MKALVTGAAGFIGSHLVEALLQAGHDVVGVDAFTDHYPPDLKRENARHLGALGCPVQEVDLRSGLPPELLDGADTVFHLAGQPGVRGSFGPGFDAYVAHNVTATQRLLESMVEHQTNRLVFASSSSVYGDQESYPVSEDAPLRAHSPYGVTKIAGEALITAYSRNYGLSAASLRYFTVFGPRQRPDMAFSRFLRGLEAGTELSLYGGGELKRDYTYVGDIVAGTLAAAERLEPGHRIFNLGGGNVASNRQVVDMLAELTGWTPRLTLTDRPRGDVARTGADTTRARTELDFAPRISLREGLPRQIEWYRSHGRS